MKFITILLFASAALAQSAANAQTTTRTTHTTSAAHTSAAAAHGCVKLPELGPKVPALPAGAPCAKALYTLTTQPAIKVEYASPEESATIREALGIEPTSFTLAYIDTKVGTGELAAPHKYYTIQYTGYLVDGTKFDSSYDHADHEPFVFGVGQHQVIPGWDTGFAGMRVGGKRRLFIPYELAYGPQGRGAIPAKAELIFDLEFLKQGDQGPAPKTPGGMGGGTPHPTAPPAGALHPSAPGTAPAAPGSAPASAPPASTPPATTGSSAPAASTPPATAPATPPKPQ
jgi:peptidylprolyl isomerase